MKRREFLASVALTGVSATVLSQQHLADFNSPVEFRSRFLQAQLLPNYPAFNFLSVDSLGKNKTNANPIRFSKSPTVASKKYRIQKTSKQAIYSLAQLKNKPAWSFDFNSKGFSLVSIFDPGIDPFVLRIDQKLNHATVLGIVKKPNQIQLPCLIHFPGTGTLSVTSPNSEAVLKVDARRFFSESDDDQKKDSVTISFPVATAQQKHLTYVVTVVKVHPDSSHIKDQLLRDAFERNYLNIFQVHPKLRVLANNSSSDPVACTLYMSAAVAQHTPTLVGNLTANDLVKMSLNRYLDGMKAYTMIGYTDNYEGSDSVSWKSDYDSLDAYPSLLLAAAFFVQSTGDKDWLFKNLKKLMSWADTIMKNDKDGDGLIEYPLSGNTGSWKGTAYQRPSSWWDTIGFGHNDALSNILAFKALSLFGSVLTSHGYTEGVAYTQFSERLRAVFYPTFFNRSTGVLAGWRSADGELHDYYFTFISSMAITYGLVDDSVGKQLMDVLLNKCKAVGFTDFSLGLPGNFMPIKKGDYTHLEPRWGGPSREDGSDAFQIYENGGATACYTYFFVEALKKLKRKADVDMILNPILKSIGDEKFSGKCSNGMSNDWKTWNGECWGYEGFLSDGYMVLLAAAEINSEHEN
jgi:hypothetical protein